MNQVDIQKKAHILVVDDDPHVLRATERLLSRDYYVEIASSGFAALERLERSEEKTIDLVISDNSMPGMKGAELLDKVHRLYPEIKCVLYTGDSKSSIDTDFKIIEKPAVAKLTKTVDQLLNNSP